MSRSFLICFIVTLCLAPAVWPTQISADEAAPKKRWAEPIPNPYLSNFHKVSEDLYRGAQPSADGNRELQRLGMRTIINLRGLHSDRRELRGTAIRYRHIRMEAILPRDEQIIRFLRIVSKKENGPFFVHCQHGADRTGTMCALYRMAFQGWSKDEAIDEMTQGGFGFHKIWNATLVNYLRGVDVDALKTKAGLLP